MVQVLLHNRQNSHEVVKNTELQISDNHAWDYVVWSDNLSQTAMILSKYHHIAPEICSERDSPLKRLYRRTHAKLAYLVGSVQLVWAAGCELSLALVHAWRPVWPVKTSAANYYYTRIQMNKVTLGGHLCFPLHGVTGSLLHVMWFYSYQSIIL